MIIELLLILLIVLFILERYYYYNDGFIFKKNKSTQLIDSNIAEYKPLDIPPSD
jgi:hypothetical protein